MDDGATRKYVNLQHLPRKLLTVYDEILIKMLDISCVRDNEFYMKRAKLGVDEMMSMLPIKPCIQHLLGIL